MKADTLTLKQVFSKDIRYVVPMFQRPYVWNQTKHWEPLWEDIRTTAERLMRAQSDSAMPSSPPFNEAVTPHFLGAIVLDQIPTGVAFIEARHVIDGQQRLTTLQLLLDAVQEVVAAHGAAIDSKTLAKLVLNDTDVITIDDHRFKVWPTNIDRDAFRAAMSDGVDATSFDGTAIADAHRYFAKQATEWICEEGDPALRANVLCTTLHSLFQLVVIDLEPHDNAQVIFETLNARGTPLLAADLVKNHVLQAAVALGLDAEALYEKYWRPFDAPYWRQEIKQGRLVRPRIDQFLNYWLELRSGAEVQAHDVFPSFRRLLSADENINGMLADLARNGAVFEQLHASPDHSLAGTFLYRWSVLEAQVLTPLLLWLFGQDEVALPRGQLHLALSSIESFLVRRSIVRQTTKNYNVLFLSALSVASSGDTQTAGSRITDFLAGQDADASYWPQDDEFARALVTSPLYKLLKRARLRMLLEAIEDDLRTPKSEDEYVTRGSLTIEHLLPRGWTTESWPLPCVSDVATESETRNVLLHTLGNLTLVSSSLNPSLSNGPWSAKQPKIDEHGILLLHKSFMGSDTWNEDEVLIRGRHLAGLALQIWARPDAVPVDPAQITFGQVDLKPTPGQGGTGQWIALEWMLKEEILDPSEVLVLEGPSMATAFEATLRADGCVIVDNGDVHISPSGAAKHYLGRNSNGWKRWRVPRLGNQRLHDLRESFEAAQDSDTDEDSGNEA